MDALLTRDGVVEELVANLSARRSLATRRRAAYGRLARVILAEATPVPCTSPVQAEPAVAA